MEKPNYSAREGNTKGPPRQDYLDDVYEDEDLAVVTLLLLWTSSEIFLGVDVKLLCCILLWISDPIFSSFRFPAVTL